MQILIYFNQYLFFYISDIINRYKEINKINWYDFFRVCAEHTQAYKKISLD